MFGYDNVPVLGESGRKSHVMRVINDAQAVIVRRIFEELSAAENGYTRIAKRLLLKKLGGRHSRTLVSARK